MKHSETVATILDKTYLMSLATNGSEGLWVADVIFVADEDFNIYWFSKPDARHSKNIEDNPNVAASISLSNSPEMEDLGLQLKGKAEKIGLLHPSLLMKFWNKSGRQGMFDAAKVIKPGCSWYKLSADEMYLIDEEKFGHDRVQVR